MARSQYIYLLMTSSGGEEIVVVAAYTVKREVLAAKSKYERAGGAMLLGLRRVRDNGKLWDTPEAVS